ncbi:N-alpha-acetyltransferase 60 [Amblyomma americanum]
MLGAGPVPLASDSSVQLRFLAPDDAPEVRRLCTDWFPIEYPDSWYHDITSNPRFFALAAMYGGRIIGLIVAESKAQSQCNREDAGLLAAHFSPAAQVAYILTLGVVRECRRNGIATLLLDSLLSHLSQQPQPAVGGGGACKAVYLHVLASNTCAIQFYERRRFRPHAFLPLYYSVRGTPRDGYSYVLYINGGHPPWTLMDYVKHWSQKVSRWEVCALPKQLLRMVGKLFSRLFSRVFASHR